MKWSSVDWTATEAVVRRIQDRIFRAAKIKRQRLEPDAEQSARPVLRGALDSNVEAPTRRSLTVWFAEAAVAAWEAEPRTTPGGQPWYSELAILTALTLRAVFRLALRQTEGLISSTARPLQGVAQTLAARHRFIPHFPYAHTSADLRAQIAV